MNARNASVVSDKVYSALGTGYDVYVNNVSLDLGYPSSIELDDGSILTVFYAHRPDEANATIMQVRWEFED
jgi:hypothetical protein